MQTLHDTVLEPLSKATESSLKPIHIGENEFLEISLDDEGKRFITQASSYRLATQYDLAYLQVEINGRQRVKDRFNVRAEIANNWQKRIPERKELGYGRWRFAATDFTALIIHHVWPKDHLLFKDGDTKILYDYLLLRFFGQAESAKLVANYKLNSILPPMPPDFVEHQDESLRLSDYQKVGLLSTLGQECSALFMQQGTGKTPTAIARINLEGKRKYVKTQQMYRVLVICPQQVRLNWETEFRRFSTVPGHVTVLRGSKFKRQRFLIDAVREAPGVAWSAAIISIDSVSNTREALQMVPWDLIVIDESHYIKDPGSNRFKTLKHFSDLGKGSRMILTGTPIANNVFDLWSQLEFLGHGMSGFSTFTNFKGFHGQFQSVGPVGTSVQKLVGLKSLPLLQERLARVAFTITKEEANLGLPDKVRDIYEVEMTAKQQQIYKKIAEELYVEIEEGLADESRTLTVDHILTMLLRLAQITSGHIKFDDPIDINGDKCGKGATIQIDEVNPKVEGVLDMLNDPDRDPRGKTIIWCCFVEDMRILSETLAADNINHVGYHVVVNSKYRVANAAEAEKHINLDPDCKVMIANPASAGVGQNLIGYDRENPDKYDTFVDHEIFFSSNWSAIQRSQAEDRAHRRGTRSPVRITDLVIPGTIDQDIRERVTNKLQQAMAIQDVKEILARLL